MTGSGTQADPYIIYDVDDLQAINNDPSAYYELANDIDASATSGWNGGLGFVPLGTGAPKFTGQLDGKGYTITSLFIDRSSESVALFHYIGVGGVVKNLGLVNCSIRAERAPAAALVIYNEGTITNCYSTGTVTAWGSGITTAGGLVKDNYAPGVVEDSYSECTVNSNFASGGFASLNESIIRRCYATGNVTDTNIGAAGFVEYNEGEITQCYATGNVHARSAAGFVRAQPAGAVIRACYARGNVQADGFSQKAAGFILNNYSNAIVEDCYAANVPTATGGGTAEAYGFCYYMYPEATGMSNCFWDTDVSGITDPSPYVTGETGKTTAEMKARSTFTDAGWDFTTPIWYIGATFNDGYPAFEGVLIPTVTTELATGRGAIAATINGTLNQDGGEVCECGLEWGLDATYGLTTLTESKITGETFSEVIGGLFPNTTYHFRAFATNSAGTGYGDDETFTTALVISRAHALAREEL